MTGTVRSLNKSTREQIIQSNEHLKLIDRQFALHLNVYIQTLEELFLKSAIRDKAKNKLGFQGFLKLMKRYDLMIKDNDAANENQIDSTSVQIIF